MRNTGIVRPLDELGRIVLPSELRRGLGISEKDPIEVFVDQEAKIIMMRKYRTEECLLCESIDNLSYFKGRFVCSACFEALKADTLTECAATVEDKPVESADKVRRWKRGQVEKRLAEVIKAHPDASQKEWAHMIGISQGRVSQLMKANQKK